MGEFVGFDLDKSTAQAWRRFQARLADHLVGMDDDDVLLVCAESSVDEEDGDCAPYVQFCAFGEVMVRGELSSNEYLAGPHTLDPEGVERLTALGWNPPTVGAGEPEGQGSANFYLDVERSHADELAVMTVRALRDGSGIPHPAFLAAGDLGEDPEAPTLEPYASSPMAASAGEPLAVAPGDAGELHRLVDAALESLFGDEVEKDDDGDVPVPWGTALVFVRVHEELPVVELFGTVASEVEHLDRAAFEVAVLNRDVRFIKFVLVGDSVLASVHLPAQPFVPEHLRSMLVGMANKLDAIGEDLVARIGGRRAMDEREPDVDDTEEPSPSTSGESRQAPPTRRELRLVRPPQVRILTDAEDLLRAHGRNDLDELDELLSTSSPWDFEVFDSVDAVEVWIGDVAIAMDYPFTLADFKKLVRDVETLASESVEVEDA